MHPRILVMLAVGFASGLLLASCGTASSCTTAIANPVVAAGSTTVSNISLDCPARVSGTLTRVPGVLPAGLTVELNPAAGGSNLVGTVQPDGSYALSGIASGVYFLFVNHLPVGCAASGGQSVSLGQRATLAKDFPVDCPLGFWATKAAMLAPRVLSAAGGDQWSPVRRGWPDR